MSEFKARKIDEYAIEVRPGYVILDGMEDLIPIETYLERKRKELKQIESDLNEMKLRVTSYIRDYLVICGHASVQFQVGCRWLSCSLTDELDIENTPYFVGRDYVNRSQMNHMIRAVYAVKQRIVLNPIHSVSTRVTQVAENDNQLLRERLRLYTYLNSVIGNDIKDVKPPQRKRKLKPIVQDASIIERIASLESRVQTLETRLDKTLSKEGSKQNGGEEVLRHGSKRSKTR